jgi:nitrogenase subunit NifH
MENQIIKLKKTIVCGGITLPVVENVTTELVKLKKGVMLQYVNAKNILKCKPIIKNADAIWLEALKQNSL